MSDLYVGDDFLLWCGTMEQGAMADEGPTFAACERLAEAGLLSRAEPIEYISVYRTTAAGIAAMGKTVQ